jgi:hypothetical protein
MNNPRLLEHIRDELKRTFRLLLRQLLREHGADRYYAIMFEIDVSGTYVIRFAGSKESLSRRAEAYTAKGYQVRSGDLQETLRALLRWDAPGDDRVGWYWGNQDDDVPLTQLVAQAVKAGLIHEYAEDQCLRRLCIEALRDLDRAGVLGDGRERETLLLGVTCVETGFGVEDVEELATLNPARVIARFREELAAAAAADKLLIRPWQHHE